MKNFDSAISKKEHQAKEWWTKCGESLKPRTKTDFLLHSLWDKLIKLIKKI